MDEMMFFRKNALLANLCKEWNDKWAACHNDKEKMMNLVLMGQSAPYFATFCYNGAGLSKEYCKREFADYLNGRVFHDCDEVEGYTYGMFIDAPNQVEMEMDVAQFLWCDSTIVNVKTSKCPQFYVSNKSEVHYVLNGYNSIRIYLFDESKVVIDDADETCDVIVYKYGNRAAVEMGRYCLGKVKIFNKQLRL